MPGCEFPALVTYGRAVNSRGDDDEVTRLALAAGRGDRAALDQFIKATQRDVWRTVAYLDEPGNADDLTQETYLRALGSLSRFRGRSTARTWLLSIARRVVVDHIRRKQCRPPAPVTCCGGFSGIPCLLLVIHRLFFLEKPATPPKKTVRG